MKEDYSNYEPVPGSFHNERDEEFFRESLWNRLRRSVLKRFKRPEDIPIVSDNLVEEYNFFRQNIYNPSRVFYPSCNTDISPIEGFPESEVILLDRGDVTKGLEGIMEKQGITQFVLEDIHNYVPESPFDLVIALNPQLPSKDLVKYLQKGGYVLANDWHKNASQLAQDTNFEGLGGFERNENGLYLKKVDFSQRDLQPLFGGHFYIFKKVGDEK